MLNNIKAKKNNDMYNSLIKFIKVNYSVILTIFIFALLELPVLDTARPIMSDEAWYSNPSYNFIVSNSFSNTNVGFGGNGLITYSIYLSAFFYLFGVSLFTARLSSIVLGMVTILIFRKFLKIFNVKEFYSFITLSFYILSNFYLSIFKHARPEALTFTFSLCILLTLYYYLNKNYNIRYLLLLILFSFLAINSHPYSSIIVLLAFIVIIYSIIKKSEYAKIFHVIIFIACVSFSSLFIVLMSSVNNNISLNESLAIILQRNSANTSFWGNLILKLKVTLDYFVFSNRVITFIPQIFLILLGLFFSKKNNFLFILSLCGIISLFIALIFIASSGFIYIYAFVFIFSILALSMLLKTFETNILINKIILTIVVSVIFINIIAFITLTKKSCDADFNNKTKEIESMLPNNSIIISEQPFWFVSPQKNIKSISYLKANNIFLNDKDFYIINCDKFTSDFKGDSNSITYLNTYNEIHNVDTLFAKFSKIYGNIYLIKFAKK